MQLITGFSEMSKYPYNIQKLFNTVYLTPIYLYTFYLVFKNIKGTFIDRTIRVIGRNSLTAFALSEVIRFWFIFIPSGMVYFSMNELQATLFSIVFAVILIGLVILDHKTRGKGKYATA